MKDIDKDCDNCNDCDTKSCRYPCSECYDDWTPPSNWTVKEE